MVSGRLAVGRLDAYLPLRRNLTNLPGVRLQQDVDRLSFQSHLFRSHRNAALVLKSLLLRSIEKRVGVGDGDLGRSLLRFLEKTRPHPVLGRKLPGPLKKSDAAGFDSVLPLDGACLSGVDGGIGCTVIPKSLGTKENGVRAPR